MKKIAILLLALTLGLSSCKKENNSIKTTEEISVNDSLSNAKTNSAEISKNSLQLEVHILANET